MRALARPSSRPSYGPASAIYIKPHTAWLITTSRPRPSIQRRLGHRSVTTTIDRYGRLLPDVDTGDLAALTLRAKGDPRTSIRGSKYQY